MKKVLLFCILVFLAGCGLENKNNFDSFSNKKVENNIYGSTKISKDFKKYLNIVNNYNLTGCDYFTGARKEKCILTILSSLNKINNEDDCKNYKIDNIKNECLKIVYEKKFMCENFSLLLDKKKCLDNKYYDKALKTNNSYWCLYIENSNKRKSCKKDIKKRLSYINKNDNPSNGKCMIFNDLNKNCGSDKNCNINKYKIKFSSNPSLKYKKNICNKISKLDKKEGEKCLYEFYKIKALNTLDHKICLNIKNKKLGYTCEQETIYQEAIENINHKLCNKLDKKNKKYQCLDEVTIRDITKNNLKDDKLCKRMHTIEYKNICINAIIKNY